MKRILAVFLSIIIIFTSVFMIDSYTYANEFESSSEVQSIEFIPAKPYEVIENAYGYWDQDEEGDTYFWYDDTNYSIYETGNKLIVNYTDGKSISYFCTNGEFCDDKGNVLDSEYLHYNDNQYENHWTIGGDNDFTVTYKGAECKVPVTIVKSPVESIIASTKSRVLAQFDFAGPIISLTVNYVDGTSKTFDNIRRSSVIDGKYVGMRQISSGKYEVSYIGATTTLTAEIINDVEVVDVDIKQIKQIDNSGGIEVLEDGYLEYTVTFSDGAVVKTTDVTLYGGSKNFCDAFMWGKYTIAFEAETECDDHDDLKDGCKIYFTFGNIKKMFTVHNHNYSNKISAPTCTAKGFTTYTCSVCGDSYVDNYVNAIGHSFDISIPNCKLCEVKNPNYLSKPSTGVNKAPIAGAKKDNFENWVSTKIKKTTIKSIKSGKRLLKVKFAKVKKINGYQIQYSTTSKFTKKTTKTILIRKISSNTIKLKKLKAGKKYYVRVRTYKTINGQNVFSKWSKKRSKKAKR